MSRTVGIIKEYVPKSWFHEKGIHKVLKDLLPRLPDVKGCLFLTLTVDPKRYSDPEEAYEESRNRIRKVFYRLRHGVMWEGRFYKIATPYCVKTEFHRNGFAHFHLLFLTKRHLPAALLNHLWELGRTEVKRVSNEDFQYLLKYVTKGGDLPEWVKGQKRIRIFQPSHGFLKALEEAAQSKPRKQCKTHRPSFTIEERLQRWKRMATWIEENPDSETPKVRSLHLGDCFRNLFDHLVYPAALDGRYLGGGQIQITNREQLTQWIINLKQLNPVPESMCAVSPFHPRPERALRKTAPAGFGSLMRSRYSPA